MLEQGQLVGYAKPAGSHDPQVAIPPAAWADLELVDDTDRCLIHRISKTEFLDLKVFPILHAPDSPQLLHDRALAEVFTTTIIRDPEVAALGTRCKTPFTCKQVFVDGFAPGLGLGTHWRLDWDTRSLADAFFPAAISFWEEQPAEPSAALMAAVAVLVDRILALRTLLSSGRLIATGTHGSSGLLSQVHRGQWLRTGQSIDVKNGDLCEPGKPQWTALWTGVILEQSRPPPLDSLDMRFQQAIDLNPKARHFSIAAEKQCELWLKELVRQYPENKVWSKSMLLKEAEKWWAGLSGEGFERAWSAATAGAAGEHWRKAGALPKGPRPAIPPPVIAGPVITHPK